MSVPLSNALVGHNAKIIVYTTSYATVATLQGVLAGVHGNTATLSGVTTTHNLDAYTTYIYELYIDNAYVSDYRGTISSLGDIVGAGGTTDNSGVDTGSGNDTGASTGDDNTTGSHTGITNTLAISIKRSTARGTVPLLVTVYDTSYRVVDTIQTNAVADTTGNINTTLTAHIPNTYATYIYEVYVNGTFLFDRTLTPTNGVTTLAYAPKVSTSVAARGQKYVHTIEDYRARLGMQVTDEMMVFTNLPASDAEAIRKAQGVASILKEFHNNNLRPIVVVEPSFEDKRNVDWAVYARGAYDGYVQTFFQTLKSEGITDNMMGVWVPFSEGNTPMWNNANAQRFVTNVNKYFSILYQNFPNAPKGAVLLHSLTYNTYDKSWSNGRNVSLRPYLAGLNKNYVGRLIYQGLPWLPPRNWSGGSRTLRFFWDIRWAIESASILNTNEVWFNTGTTHSRHTNNPATANYMSDAEREQFMNYIVDDVLRVKNTGLNVKINLFAHEKDGRNWSYWSGDAANTDGENILRRFVTRLVQNGIGLSIADLY